MSIRSNLTAGVIVAITGAAMFAGPAAAASGPALTVQTDAGTSCTLDASATVGGGLFGIAPIVFKGDIGCSLANDANAPLYEGGVRLTSNLLGLGVLPLDLDNIGAAAAQPNSPSNTEATPPPPGEGALFVCRLDPGYDCGSTGQTTGLPATPYQVMHFATLSAPAGETWTDAPEGCQLSPSDRGPDTAVSCIATTDPFTTG